MKFKEITTFEIFTIHDVIISEYKITGGCENKGSIESLLAKINFLNYDDIYKRAALLLEGIIRLHPFIDGNKRTALQATKQYLNFNNHILVFPLSTVAFTYKIANTIKMILIVMMN